MVLEQAKGFSKTTGYKLTHAAGGCSCENPNGQRRTSNTPCTGFYGL